MSALAKPIQEYPVQGLMPKQDTQAAAFIKKYPSYDGRGTVIAILDTGVDPGAAGMQVTTDGKPKVIDIVDCTGGGDVTTTKVVKPAEKDGVKTITGLSGRDLILDPSWNCPSGEYRIGIKRAYELFPTELVSKLKKLRRKTFDDNQSRLLSDAQAKLAAFDKENPKISDEKLAAERSDLEDRVETLKSLWSTYEDPGVILDCVVFNDGKDWRAVIDVEESGDLRGQPCLTDYRKELKYHTFGKADLLNFSVNIYDNGDLLSIVTLSGSHGTHVAGITAANFPDDPALNGVAPGAQIVSLRIGDARLGSMETGPGLTRAAAHMAINKVDLANMSYGEAASLPTDGHFIQLLAQEAIAKSGCIFVTSAGNDGPCFSSIGAPAGMAASFITVGAYVKHAQMQAEYALLESVAERPYTWSSRGPCTDGFRGVDIYAPGSAITSVPVYGLNRLDLKNGTSMSSPNACGCVALLLSGLKAEKKHYTPYRLKNSIVETGKQVDDPLKVGFIQVEKAWDYMENYKELKDLDILFQTTVLKSGSKRGVYLREYEEANQVQYLTVKISPTFMGETDPEHPKYNQAKFEFDARVALIPSEPWIYAPDFVYLHSGGNAFQIKVDPTALAEDKFHYGEVLGYDTTNPDRGALFRVPVSVVKSIRPQHGRIQSLNVDFGPGEALRKFVDVPEGANYARLTIRSKTPINTSPARFMLHLLQCVPKKSQKNKQTYSFLLGSGSYGDADSEDQVVTKRFAVRGGLVLELCLAQFWSGLGKHLVDLDLEFYGVRFASHSTNGQGLLCLHPHITKVDFVSSIRRQDKVDVSVSFNKLRKYLRPTESSITPLRPERNTLPSGRLLYELVLTYNFKAEAGASITPLFPPVMNQLYEHYLAGVFGIVYDANCKVVDHLDVFEHTIKLENKGEYSIMLQLTTEDEKTLEKLKTLVCELDFDIKSVSFNPYSTIADAYTGGSAASKWALERGETKALYIAAPTGEDTGFPKEAKAGDALVGTLTFTNNKVDGGQYQALYTIPPEAKSDKKDKKDKADSDKKDDSQVQDDLKNAVKELQISYLDKFTDDKSSAKQTLLKALEKEFPSDIALLLYKVNDAWKAAGGVKECLTKEEGLPQDKATEIIQLCDKILSQIDETALLEFVASHKKEDPNEDDATKKARKENDKKKEHVIFAYKNKVLALAGVLTAEKGHEELKASVKSLQKWGEDKKDLSLVLAKAKTDRVQGHYGSALKKINGYLGETGITKDSLADVQKAWEARNKFYKALGWSLWHTYDTKWELIRSPPGGHAPF